MKKRRVLHSFLGAALAAALALPLSALTYGPAAPDGFPDVDPGKTLVGVQTADVDSSSLSYSVPLYVTLAVTNQKGTATVLTPDDYRMFNGSLTPDNKPAPIGVTAIDVEGIKGRTWKLTSNPQLAKPGQPNEISLTLGGVPLPELAADATKAVSANITAENNVFYTKGATTELGKYQHIAGKDDGGTSIPIVGKLAPGFTIDQDVPTVPQFRLHYTVSLLNGAGKPIGAFYDGPDPTEKAPSTGGTP